MKKFILTFLAAGAWASAQAQLFTPESTTGALIGGIAGGIIGNNHGHQGAAGAAIGAGAGLLLGSLAHEANEDRYYGGGYYAAPYSAYYGPAYSFTWGIRTAVLGTTFWIRFFRGRAGAYYAPFYYAPRRAYYYATSPAPMMAQQPDPAPPSQSVNAKNSSYNDLPSSSMSGANSLFGR